MRTTDATPAAEVEGAGVRFQDLHVSDPPDQGRRPRRGTGRGHRRAQGGQCAGDAFLQARSRMGECGQEVSEKLEYIKHVDLTDDLLDCCPSFPFRSVGFFLVADFTAASPSP